MAVLVILASLVLTLSVTTPTAAIEYVLSALQDVSVVSDVNLNSYNRLGVGYQENTMVRSLVQFALEPIPHDCTLQQATMYIYISTIVRLFPKAQHTG